MAFRTSLARTAMDFARGDTMLRVLKLVALLNLRRGTGRGKQEARAESCELCKPCAEHRKDCISVLGSREGVSQIVDTC